MNRRILLVTAAVVLALIGTISVYSYAKSADNRAVAGAKATTVVVTAKRVPAGTTWAATVKGGYLKTEHLPADAAPLSALTSIAESAIGKNAVAESDIAPGQILLRQSFGTSTPKTGVLAIPKGDIAISLNVPSEADVANYVAPGSQVIVFVTSQLKTKTKYAMTNGGDLMVTRTVVPRATVLTTSNSTPTSVAGTDTNVTTNSDTATMLTVALSQYDAERVILAKNVGTLYLGLLSASSKVDQDGGVLNAGAFTPVPVWLAGQGEPPIGEPKVKNSVATQTTATK